MRGAHEDMHLVQLHTINLHHFLWRIILIEKSRVLLLLMGCLPRVCLLCGRTGKS